MHDVVVGVALVDGHMDHQPVRRGAVPVLLAGLEQEVTGTDDLDQPAPAPAQADPPVTKTVWLSGWRCQWVRAPGMKCTRLALTRDGAGAAATASR